MCGYVGDGLRDGLGGGLSGGKAGGLGGRLGGGLGCSDGGGLQWLGQLSAWAVEREDALLSCDLMSRI